MAKNQINYSDLSTNELEMLKDMYIDLKVKSMNMNDLKEFAIENISIQIKNTIGNEEELDAWNEMEQFFKDEFENTIKDIQKKIKSSNIQLTDSISVGKACETGNEGTDKKLDMWED